MSEIYDVAIIGGGPAGMMAAISAGENGVKVVILERNNELGKKMLMTGKGRCNFSNVAEMDDFIEAYGDKGKLIYGPLSKFSNYDMVSFLEERGVKTKLERGGRFFPESDKSTTIRDCLEKEIRKKGVEIKFNSRVKKVSFKDSLFTIITENKEIKAKKVILTTGGISYPHTGSSGDGHRLTKNLGHKVTELVPGLSALYVKDKNMRAMAGLDLDNVGVSVYSFDDLSDFEKEKINREVWIKDNQLLFEKVFNKKNLVMETFGDVLFTHQGISGPCILITSKHIYKEQEKGNQIFIKIDIKPSLSEEALRERIDGDIEEIREKEYKTLLKGLLPRSLIDFAIFKTGIAGDKKNKSLDEKDRHKLVSFLKNFVIYIDGVSPIKNAIVTSGGVETSEIDFKTMESRIQPGLYLAGEVIDVDGVTGGYNLQFAFSSGWVAGKNAVNR